MANLSSFAEMDTSHLEKARATLFLDDGGWYQNGRFVSLCCNVPTPNVSALDPQDRLTLAVRSINLLRMI